MRVLWVLTCGVLAAFPSFAPDTAPTLASCRICSEHWGISDWSSLRLGQLGVAHLSAGDELRVYGLGTRPRPTAHTPNRSGIPACDHNCFQATEHLPGVSRLSSLSPKLRLADEAVEA